MEQIKFLVRSDHRRDAEGRDLVRLAGLQGVELEVAGLAQRLRLRGVAGLAHRLANRFRGRLAAGEVGHAQPAGLEALQLEGVQRRLGRPDGQPVGADGALLHGLHVGVAGVLDHLGKFIIIKYKFKIQKFWAIRGRSRSYARARVKVYPNAS